MKLHNSMSMLPPVLTGNQERTCTINSIPVIFMMAGVKTFPWSKSDTVCINVTIFPICIWHFIACRCPVEIWVAIKSSRIKPKVADSLTMFHIIYKKWNNRLINWLTDGSEILKAIYNKWYITYFCHILATDIWIPSPSIRTPPTYNIPTGWVVGLSGEFESMIISNPQSKSYMYSVWIPWFFKL